MRSWWSKLALVGSILLLPTRIGIGEESLADRLAPILEQERIRIWFEGSPGFGHQSATFNLMNRLRELGYEGEFEVVFGLRNGNRKKMETLFPGYRYSRRPVVLPGEKITMIPATVANELLLATDPIEVGFTGGMDVGSNTKAVHSPQRVGTHYLLGMQPKGWKHSPFLRSGFVETAYIVRGLKEMTIRSKAPTRDQAIEAIQRSNLSEPVKTDLTTLLKRREDIFHVPIYGLHDKRKNVDHWAREIFEGVLDARKAIPEADQKPIVVIAPGSVVSEGYMPAINPVSGRIKRVDLRKGDRIPELRKNLNKSVIFIETPSLPKDVVDYLLTDPDGFTFTAGWNAESLVRTTGKPNVNMNRIAERTGNVQVDAKLRFVSSNLKQPTENFKTSDSIAELFEDIHANPEIYRETFEALIPDPSDDMHLRGFEILSDSMRKDRKRNPNRTFGANCVQRGIHRGVKALLRRE